MRVVSSRVVYENRWIRVHEDRTERADGTPGLYGWIEKPPAALIVPIDGGFVWLIEQFRHPVGERFWEFPQGAWEGDPQEPGIMTLVTPKATTTTSTTPSPTKTHGSRFMVHPLALECLSARRTP